MGKKKEKRSLVSNTSAAKETVVLIGEGQVLAGRYKVVERIGMGGMGMIFRAEDQELDNRTVALKVLPPEMSGNSAAIKRLKKEALASIELHHPHIMAVHSFEADGPHHFLVMEYLTGPDLEHAVIDAERFETEKVLEIARQLCGALDYAHKKGVIHRDIKPANILYTDDNGEQIVKIADFGIAYQVRNSIARLTGQDLSAGTLHYMPPEQLAGKRVDARADQYALAASFYELLCGRPPFDGSGLMLMRQIEEKTPEAIDEVPPHINDAIQKALSKDPAERFDCCTAFLEALGQKGDSPKVVVVPAVDEPPIEVPTVEEPPDDAFPQEEANSPAIEALSLEVNPVEEGTTAEEQALMVEEAAVTPCDDSLQKEEAVEQGKSSPEPEPSIREDERQNAPEAQFSSWSCFKTCFWVSGMLLCLAAGTIYGFYHFLGFGAADEAGSYFSMVDRLSTNEIEDSFHSSLNKQCDPTALALLLKTVSREMGAYKRPSSKIGFSKSFQNGRYEKGFEGTLLFEKGTLSLKMSFVDGKLSKFEIDDEEALKELLQKQGLPEDTSKYEKYAEAFWLDFVSGKVYEARKRMSGPLQKLNEPESLERLSETFSDNGGLKRIEFIKAMPDPYEPSNLVILHKIVFEKATFNGHVTFQLRGWKSDLVDFLIPSHYHEASFETAKLSDYFAMAERASVKELEDTFYPTLKKDCDPTVLALFIKAISKELGKFKKPEMNGFEFTDEAKYDVRIRSYKGNMVFEKGTVSLEIAFFDEKLGAIRVTDESMGKRLLKNRDLSKDTSKYEKLAEKLWRALLTGNSDDAFSLMSEPLQKQLGRAGVSKQSKNLARNGALKTIKLSKVMLDPKNPSKLLILHKCSMTKGSAVGHVTFQFAGLKSYLIAFKIPSPYANK